MAETKPNGLAARLKDAERTRGIVVAPGVYDALSAGIASAAGFDTLYLSGAAIAYCRLGRPDIAATLYGFTCHHPTGDLLRVAELARADLGEDRFGQQCDVGAVMELAEAVRYARNCIEEARNALAAGG